MSNIYRWGHACAVLDNTLVVAGGFSLTYLSSTELVDLTSGQGRRGGSLLQPRGSVKPHHQPPPPSAGTLDWPCWAPPWWRWEAMPAGRLASWTVRRRAAPPGSGPGGRTASGRPGSASGRSPYLQRLSADNCFNMSTHQNQALTVVNFFTGNCLMNTDDICELIKVRDKKSLFNYFLFYSTRFLVPFLHPFWQY